MDCAACARKVENAVRQVSGVNQVQVLFATEKLVVDAGSDIRQQVENAVQKQAIPCAMSTRRTPPRVTF
jgi:Cd2+/Zn2+-exporting ATPase